MQDMWLHDVEHVTKRGTQRRVAIAAVKVCELPGVDQFGHRDAVVRSPGQLAVQPRRIEFGGHDRRLKTGTALRGAQVRDVDFRPRLVPREVVVNGVENPEGGHGVGWPEYRIMSSCRCGRLDNSA